jgi:hypothetical protein
MTDPFAPVEPGPQAGSQVPSPASSVPFSHTVSTPPPPVIAPVKKTDRTFAILLAVGLLIAVGGVTFAVGRITAPAAAATTRGNGGFGNGGFGNGGAGGTGVAGAAGAAGLGRGGFGGGVLVTGTVDSISGTTMTLKEANGSTVTVNLAGTTTYHAQAAATSADVTTGKQVQVEVQIAGGFGGQGVPGASPGADASPVPGASAPTRTITARDVTLVTP